MPISMSSKFTGSWTEAVVGEGKKLLMFIGIYTIMWITLFGQSFDWKFMFLRIGILAI